MSCAAVYPFKGALIGGANRSVMLDVCAVATCTAMLEFVCQSCETRKNAGINAMMDGTST